MRAVALAVSLVAAVMGRVLVSLLFLVNMCLCRFKYAANRMHAAAVVDTLGISLCMIGFAVSAPDLFSGLKILLVVVFWWLSSPVASHLLCRLEIETDEQRDEYMTVHNGTLAQERMEASAAETVEKEEQA